MHEPGNAGQDPQAAEPLDALLLDLFTRAPVAGDEGSLAVERTGDHAAAEAFTRATMQRIHAGQRRHAWLRTGSTCMALAIAASALTAGGAFTPDAATLATIAEAFTRALATPATWGATVVTLFALRSIAHALPGYGR